MKPDTDEAFFAALQGEDDLGIVVRSAIHIEFELIQLLKQSVQDSDSLDKMGLDYHGRIQLAVALGLGRDFMAPLKTLGSIRNRFAHQLGTALGKSEVDSFYRAFKGEDRTTIHTLHDRLVKQHSFAQAVPFAQREPRDKFAVLAITLRGIVKVAQFQQAQYAAAVHSALQRERVGS